MASCKKRSDPIDTLLTPIDTDAIDSPVCMIARPDPPYLLQAALRSAGETHPLSLSLAVSVTRLSHTPGDRRVLCGALSRLEPCAVKVARTALRGRGDGNVTSLPDGSQPFFLFSPPCSR
jgi:hypothetical protein